MNRRVFLGALLAPFILRFRKLFGIATPEPEGISIRFVRTFGAMGSHSRMDVLYGFGALQPELSCMVVGGEDGPEPMRVRFNPARLPA